MNIVEQCHIIRINFAFGLCYVFYRSRRKPTLKWYGNQQRKIYKSFTFDRVKRDSSSIWVLIHLYHSPNNDNSRAVNVQIIAWNFQLWII